jgi:hypothetical protein
VADEAHLIALDRLVVEGFAEPLLACFNRCVGDECVIAIERPRPVPIPPDDLWQPPFGIIMLGISCPDVIARAAAHDYEPSEKIDALLAQIRDRPPCSRWLVIRAIDGGMSARLLLPVGASA